VKELVHRLKRKPDISVTGVGRPKLRVEVAPTVAHAKKMEWKVHKAGKVYTAHRKKKTWKVSGKVQKRRDIGRLGRGKRVIKIKRRGLLKKHGYGVHKSVRERRSALKKVDKLVGSPALFKMLNAQVIFRKHMPDGVKRTFESDRDWIKRNLLSKKEALAMTKAPRKKWVGMSPEARAKAMPERK